MRARNIKPGFFTNEKLAIADPIYGHIFAGLWCMADRKGRLEDRPAKIHMTINPGRAYDTTERSLIWLSDQGFILRYVSQGIALIQVIEFLKHQNPHHKEPPSKLPEPGSNPGLKDDTQATNPGSSTHIYKEYRPETQVQPGASPGFSPHERVMHGGETVLIPDSGFRIPDSPSPNPFPPSGQGAFSPNGDEGPKNPTPRQAGTNPRAQGRSPRANGTNARKDRADSLQAWGAMLEGAKRSYAREGIERSDPRIAEVVRQLGGWSRLGQSSEHQLPALKGRFRELYEQLTERASP